MALKYLGPTFDIHGGGEDLLFSHHESERAHAECYTGVQPFVRFWVYGGTVYSPGSRGGSAAKMSKSLGNLVLVRELLTRFSADAVRLYLVWEHYRAHLTYDEGRLTEADALAGRLRRAAAAAPGPGARGEELGDFRGRFEAAMDADLDTPTAVGVLLDLAAAIERAPESAEQVALGPLLVELAAVLGLRLADQPTTVWPR